MRDEEASHASEIVGEPHPSKQGLKQVIHFLHEPGQNPSASPIHQNKD